MSQIPFVVGAYASLPQDRQAQQEYYALWAQTPWCAGLELPYPGDLREHSDWLLDQLSPEWTTNTITAIPGTMQNVWKAGNFGLASADDDGRAAALDFTREIRERVCSLADRAGRAVIRYVQLHSAPTAGAHADAFARSLDEAQSWDWAGAELVIEHCDAPRAGRKPEKGFLELDQEVEVAAKTGVGIHINWGRSCLEERDAKAPLAHIVRAGEAGVLRGVLFSGAGPEATQYGYEWIDGHLPHLSDEPTSLMGETQIRECAQAARAAGVRYLGAKICVPAAATLAERKAMLERIYAATR